MQLNTAQVAAMAEQACFYVTPIGTWLRIEWCDLEGAGKFCALDESSGEDYIITFDEVAENDDPHFEKLVRVAVPVGLK